MLIDTAVLVRRAQASQRPVFAFNVITLEHAQAIVSGAALAGQAVILQVSENAVRYHGGAAAIMAACAVLASDAEVDVSLHLDHVESPDLLHAAEELGASSVMVDGSRLPDPENLAFTAAAARWGHTRGLFVEAELGAIGGKGHAHTAGVRTDPDQAAFFVEKTGVDALAVAVGSSHAMTSRSAVLDHELIRALAAAVPVPLVLHGSSGVPAEALRCAAADGMVKINVGTLLNVAFTKAVRATLADNAGVDPRRYLGAGRDAARAAVVQLLEDVALSIR